MVALNRHKADGIYKINNLFLNILNFIVFLNLILWFLNKWMKLSDKKKTENLVKRTKHMTQLNS